MKAGEAQAAHKRSTAQKRLVSKAPGAVAEQWAQPLSVGSVQCLSV